MQITSRMLALFVVEYFVARTQAFQLSNGHLTRPIYLSRLPELQAEDAGSKSTELVQGRQAATPQEDQKTSNSKFKKVFKQRRWASYPPKGVEKRAVAWIQNNQQDASTYDWYDY